jgi:hypothetical protein
MRIFDSSGIGIEHSIPGDATSNSATSPTRSDHQRASSPTGSAVNINTDDGILDVHFHHIPLTNASLVARFRAGNIAPELLAAKHILWLPSLHAGLMLWRLVATTHDSGIAHDKPIISYSDLFVTICSCPQNFLAPLLAIFYTECENSVAQRICAYC